MQSWLWVIPLTRITAKQAKTLMPPWKNWARRAWPNVWTVIWTFRPHRKLGVPKWQAWCSNWLLPAPLLRLVLHQVQAAAWWPSSITRRKTHTAQLCQWAKKSPLMTRTKTCATSKLIWPIRAYTMPQAMLWACGSAMMRHWWPKYWAWQV